MAPAKCCVDGCKSNSDTHRLFTIPRYEKLRELWLSFLLPCNPHLAELSKHQLLYRRVCHKHFERRQFDQQGNRLRHGYPTLFTDKEIEIGAPLLTSEPDHLTDHNYCVDTELNVQDDMMTDQDDNISSNEVYQDAEADKNRFTWQEDDVQAVDNIYDEDEPMHGRTSPETIIICGKNGDLSEEGKSENISEPPSRCNNCDRPITGFSYKCVECVTYVQCSACEANGVHAVHCVLRLSTSFDTQCQVEMDAVIDNIRNIFTSLNKYSGIKTEVKEEYIYLDPLEEVTCLESVYDVDTGENTVVDLFDTDTSKIKRKYAMRKNRNRDKFDIRQKNRHEDQSSEVILEESTQEQEFIELQSNGTEFVVDYLYDKTKRKCQNQRSSQKQLNTCLTVHDKFIDRGKRSLPKLKRRDKLLIRVD